MKAKLLKIKDIKASANEGFTLIELLVVIGILAILMGIVLIAINPAHQFALANDTNRRNAVAQILSGVGQYEAEHNGSLPPTITANAAYNPATGLATTDISDTGIDLCKDLVAATPQYLPALPEDPLNNNGADVTAVGTPPSCGTYTSGYKVAVDANKRVTISAPKFEAAATIIQVSR